MKISTWNRRISWGITREEYWINRKLRTHFNKPLVSASNLLSEEDQAKIISYIRIALPIKYSLVEVIQEKNTLKFKVRAAFNPYIKELHGDVEGYKNILQHIREKINSSLNKRFKTCKVFYLDYESEPEMDSINVVFNPKWKRYENYEILFRSKRQLARARGL